MPNPEGYRKALRVMQMAEQFDLPIFTFVDTPGAFPGIGAEERGQAEAIARNLREMAALTVPVIVTVTGEGGSAGRPGHRRRQPGADDGIFGLRGHLSRRVRRDPLERRHQGAAGRRGPQAHRQDISELGCVIDDVIPEPLAGRTTTRQRPPPSVKAYLEKLPGTQATSPARNWSSSATRSSAP